MLVEPIEEAYFNWLYSQVVTQDGPPTPSTSYLKLFRILHSTLFMETEWVPNDDNRAEDGLELRTFFLNQTRYQEDLYWASSGCSVLEMLIAFANRAEFESLYDHQFWFWRFLENLDLVRFNDAYAGSFDEVSHILERFLCRTYSFSGKGGMFPLRHPHEDQRNVEIAYQFFAYCAENE